MEQLHTNTPVAGERTFPYPGFANTYGGYYTCSVVMSEVFWVPPPVSAVGRQLRSGSLTGPPRTGPTDAG